MTSLKLSDLKQFLGCELYKIYSYELILLIMYKNIYFSFNNNYQIFLNTTKGF